MRPAQAHPLCRREDKRPDSQLNAVEFSGPVVAAGNKAVIAVVAANAPVDDVVSIIVDVLFADGGVSVG
jgi:hypothetical protein